MLYIVFGTKLVMSDHTKSRIKSTRRVNQTLDFSYAFHSSQEPYEFR